MGKQEIQDWSAKHDVGIRATFVPWSQSRNKDEKDDRGQPRLSLNWRVTLYKAHRDILETDYMAGVAHCPAHKRIKKQHAPSVDEWRKVEWECENGREVSRFIYGESLHGSKPIAPDLCDVLASLSMDSSVLDEACFEDWATALGYDSDSRKAEAIYRQCLELALKLRNGLGEAALAELRDACQDY